MEPFKHIRCEHCGQTRVVRDEAAYKEWSASVDRSIAAHNAKIGAKISAWRSKLEAEIKRGKA